MLKLVFIFPPHAFTLLLCMYVSQPIYKIVLCVFKCHINGKNNSEKHYFLKTLFVIYPLIHVDLVHFNSCILLNEEIIIYMSLSF